MASRDIANMHLFLDLKKKFPDLPDDTLRTFVPLYAEDQDKCISLLQKESKNHYNPSQPFADFRLPDSKVNNTRNDEVKNATARSANEYFVPEGYAASFHQPGMHVATSNIQIPSGRSTSHAGVIHLPGKSPNPNMPSRSVSHSAPVMAGSEKPFCNIYKQIPVSSHSSLCQQPNAREKYNQMIFSTTKEHIIQQPSAAVSQEASAYLPISAEREPSKRHAVKLSITPSFPLQQHVNVFNSNSVCATASHSSRPGRHTTSLNFQLQPSDNYPIEISTIPTNIGDPCNSRDFGSHVQVSVGSQGTTFTALRLQRPSYSQNTSHLPVCEESPFDYPLSSQGQNSALYLSSDGRVQHGRGISEAFMYSPSHNASRRAEEAFTLKDIQFKSVQNYQLSPDYILAVKNHQIAQLDLILSELEKEKALCSRLKEDVNEMEQEVSQRRASKASLFNAEELSKLREENRKLRIECNCLLMEVDMSNSGQIPLGVTDEDFYSNINTGPNGAITSASSKAPTVDREKLLIQSKTKSSFEDDEDDERNRWRCKKCTFANHPALEKCEICEMNKSSGSFFDDN